MLRNLFSLKLIAVVVGVFCILVLSGCEKTDPTTNTLGGVIDRK